MAGSGFDWNETLVAQLTALWLAVPMLSAAEIGRRMGISKNAVIGKVGRLGLPRRESPIRAPLVDAEGQRVRMAPRLTEKQSQANAYGVVAAVAQPVPEAPQAVPMAQRYVSGRGEPCSWPIGEPGKPSFHFCNAAVTRGVYCEDHAAIAYLRVRDRREDAA